MSFDQAAGGAETMREHLKRGRIASIAPVVAMLLLVGGCTALPLATLGTVLGIATSAASGGSEVYSQGKLDDVFAVDYEACREATVVAAGDLALHLKEDRQKDAKKKMWFFRFTDDQGAKIDVTVQERTPHLCRVRVDVGWFGSEPTAKLFMARIRAHLSAGIGMGQTTRPV